MALKARDDELERMKSSTHNRQEGLYYSQERMTEKNGIFVIREASEKEERSRSASGNHPPQQRAAGSVIGQ